MARPAAFHRPGEGVYVDVTVTPNKSVTGGASGYWKANVGALPVPDRRYSADTCTVVAKTDWIKILFGQEKVAGDGLRNLLVINMSPDYAAGVVNMADQIKEPSLAQIWEKVEIAAEQSELPASEPENTVSLNAAMALIAVDKHISCVDFMQISAFAKHAAKGSSQIALDPVVRIEFKSSLLHGLVEALRDATKHIERDPVEESDDE
jgi:hypothetical protein